MTHHFQADVVPTKALSSRRRFDSLSASVDSMAMIRDRDLRCRSPRSLRMNIPKRKWGRGRLESAAPVHTRFSMSHMSHMSPCQHHASMSWSWKCLMDFWRHDSRAKAAPLQRPEAGGGRAMSQPGITKLTSFCIRCTGGSSSSQLGDFVKRQAWWKWWTCSNVCRISRQSASPLELMPWSHDHVTQYLMRDAAMFDFAHLCT